MRVVASALADVLIVEPDRFEDERGSFMETYSARRYREAGIDATFVQDNLTRSHKGVVRGLHLQYPNSQGKLVSAVAGAAFDVAVDVRRGSPAHGQWIGVELSADNKRQLWIPEGFAHGFCALADDTLIAYKATTHYDPGAEVTVLWNDPAIGVEWPVVSPLLSAKDAAGTPLAAIDPARLPAWNGAR